MKTKQELNFVQRLLLQKDHIPTDLMREFYKRMKVAPQVPAKLKSGIGPERAVSDYIDALTFGKNLEEKKQGYVLVHEYEEEGKKCKLTLEQGFLSDWEICYPATYFESEKAKYVMDAAMHMIQGMELQIVSEGIEEKEQYKTMEALGIDYIQGFYFSRPVEKSAFIELIKQRRDK